ncbi:Hypothetical protein ORPV_5 [Orpheovirus IHUMI-LCC2]|uniref:Uncharacterized protein n=1 Tax=Orpheovirus IHUMI-LCC2 TaxID=2023057 RepID=A0A2I2L356_9VIRU|nr:Hypothetical protein ORPV_5 [Orpheovirus IHUMI-LCC2]SNW61909.1 Hypothetical protein ORPV_5 [Orpheovirus IHUMI-LCC2]
MISVDRGLNILVDDSDITISQNCISMLKEYNINHETVNKKLLYSLIGNEINDTYNLQRLAALSITKHTDLLKIYDMMPEHFYYIKTVYAIEVRKIKYQDTTHNPIFILYLFMLCIEDKLETKLNKIYDMEWNLLMNYIYGDSKRPHKDDILLYINTLFISAKLKLGP